MSFAAMTTAWSPLDGQGPGSTTQQQQQPPQQQKQVLLDGRRSPTSLSQQSHQLRNSCDACNLAKVRCSKARPACKRCETRNLCCVYGISLRSAKRHRSGTAGSTEQQPSASINSSKVDHARPNSTAPVKPTTGVEVLTPAPSTSTSISGTPKVTSSIIPTPAPPPLLSDAGFESLFLDCWDMDFADAGKLGENDGEMDATMMDHNDGLMHRESPLDLFQAGLSSAEDTPAFSGDGDLPNAKRHQRQLQSSLLTPITNTPSSASLFCSSSSAACSCQRNVLTKLSELPNNRQGAAGGPPVPFDEFLTEMKAVLAVCMSTLECAVTDHKEDLVLGITLVALVVHVIVMYDRMLSSLYRPGSSSSSNSNSSTPGAHGSSNSSVIGTAIQDLDKGAQLATLLPIRLSLGSYQLDQRDEQILQANLLKMELSKVGTLVEAFEKRFCTAADEELAETNPVVDMLAHFKKKLRSNYEMVRSWTQSL